MYREKKFLAIIPARSGSKGLPNKNIKPLNGKPLIAYTIEAAIKSSIFDDVIVSTDSKEYAEIAREYGASVPELRSEELSSDEASTVDVIIDLINKLRGYGKEYDYFVLLQPTSPLRDENDIIKACELLIDNNLDTVVSVCEEEHPLFLYNTLPEDNSLNEFIDKEYIKKRRQDSKKIYRINGAIYIANIKEYLINKDFYGIKSKAYVMDKKKSVDIDTELDFQFVEFLINK